ncbi:hypothetical protein F5B20DRAFT_452201 [Whalleya microplaca]|nr:hypothetical protein F5B20DRAFT_452201 [Whalleya microplaca]
MDSPHNEGGNVDGTNQRLRLLKGMEWKPAGHQQYTPPKAVSEYIHRALPPRPMSNASSVYSSPDEDAQRHPIPKSRLPFSQSNDDHPTSFAGALDEEALAMVRPQSNIDTPQPQQHQDITSPQPRRSVHRPLELKTKDAMIVSPLSAALSEADPHNPYVVSPLSPDGSASEHSCDMTISEPDHTPDTKHNSWARSSIVSNRRSRQHSLIWNDPTKRLSTSLQGTSTQSESLHPQLHKINLRYSDPGSPVSSVAMDPLSFGEPAPDVRRTFRSSGAQQHQAARNRQSAYGYLGGSSSKGKLASIPDPKISFAVAKNDGFSTRPTASKHHPVPPPLQLKERPLADNYVKTPFPPSADSSDVSQSVFEEDDESIKKHKRVSSFSDFAKVLRPVPTPSSDSLAAKQNKARHNEGPNRASPVPKVRSILSRAKHGLGQGLGIIVDETRKDKKREILKRQIRVGTPGKSS